MSCGLLAEITVDGKYGPGDLAPATGDVTVAVRVLGPAWATADRVELYANGVKVREAAIEDEGKAGREVGRRRGRCRGRRTTSTSSRSRPGRASRGCSGRSRSRTSRRRRSSGSASSG